MAGLGIGAIARNVSHELAFQGRITPRIVVVNHREFEFTYKHMDGNIF
jgi:hypothetical protein